jgi:archaemetzincin
MKHILIALLFFGLTNCNENDSKVEIVKNKLPKNKVLAVEKLNDVKKIKSSIVIIQPFSGVSGTQVSYIYNQLKKVIPQVVLNPSIPLPSRAYYKPRNRYRADTLNLFLKERTKNGYVTIGLTNKDISTDNGNIVDWGVMGLAYMPGKSCTVSPFRLSKKNANEQFFKVAIHELGHTQGLDHCLNNTCIMTDANGKNNTDREKGFCARCKPFLEKKGWNLKDL